MSEKGSKSDKRGKSEKSESSKERPRKNKEGLGTAETSKKAGASGEAVQESELAQTNDQETIDHWKMPTWTKDDLPGGLLVESSFSTLFPKYREKYLREVWPLFTSLLDKQGIIPVLDLIAGSMTVKTTRKTWDPYVILKARDVMKLLARSVPLQEAQRAMEDDTDVEIIPIGGSNKARFVKRRQRLIGPQGSTLKAIQLLTGCYMLVQGNTVACMGNFKRLKHVRRIVEDCIYQNIHPIYHVKQLMVQAELAKDPKMANESWDRFLPQYKKKHQKKSETKKAQKKKAQKEKPYTPFPPPPAMSKVDLALESGEYFKTARTKAVENAKAKAAKQKLDKQVRESQRAKAYVAPPE